MKRPVINLWIIYPLLIILFLSIVLTAWCFRDVFMTPESVAEKHPDRFDYFYIYNSLLFFGSLIISLMTATVIPFILFRKRYKWIWYTVLSILAAIALTLFKLTDFRVVLVLLLEGVLAYFWMRRPNKVWYKILYK